MDQQFTVKQWKLAEAPALEAILEASGSARVVTEMLRIWYKTQILDGMQRDINRAFSVVPKQD
jgi:hypothetical protein